MTEKKIDDEMISNLVRSVHYQIPDRVDEQVKASMAKIETGKPRLFKRPLFWYPVSAAAVVIIAVLVIFQPFVDRESSDTAAPITEIKTEFELRDKNIKILWVQKKDFKLRKVK